jgi:hypothetical protein
MDGVMKGGLMADPKKIAKKDQGDKTLEKILGGTISSSNPIEDKPRPVVSQVHIDTLKDTRVVSIPPNIYASLQDYCTENNKDIQDVINDIVFDFLFTKGNIRKLAEHYIKLDDLEAQAVNLIKKTLPEYVKDQSDDFCENVIKVPRWQHLMGIYRLAYDMSLFAQPLIDPGWEEKVEVKSQSKCPHCKQMFKPSYIGQLYCTNSCGSEAYQGIER